MSLRSEHNEQEEPLNNVKPDHVDHKLERVGTNKSHNWIQRGVEMTCDGNHDHYPHGFKLPPELVFVAETDTGLQFKNVTTGTEIVHKFV